MIGLYLSQDLLGPGDEDLVCIRKPFLDRKSVV